MKRFLKKSLLFLICTLSFYSLVVAVTLTCMRQQATAKLSHTPANIILGHSHPECAFNDALIENFQNLSASGEAAFYTYQKLKLILKENPGIENVFIEFSNNMITDSKDLWIWGDEKMNAFFPQYSPFMDTEDLWILLKNNPESFLFNLSIATRIHLQDLLLGRTDYAHKLGGYLPLKKKLDLKSPVAPEPNSHTTQKKQKVALSPTHLYYTKRLVEYCQAHNINTYLIRSPQHQNFAGRENEKVFQQQKERLFPDVEFLDFCNFPLDNSEFADRGHLNAKGAEVFSLWFQKLIENGLFNEQDKSTYIQKNIQEMISN